MQHTIETRPGCIQAALHIIGDKWTALILRELHGEPKRFNQLQSILTGISPRTLSQRLDKLQEYEVVEKKDLTEPKTCTVYALTPKGDDFAGILEQMAAWGEKYYHK